MKMAPVSYTHLFYDSPTGFRHGPKSLVDNETLVVVFVSSHPYTRQYDLDLLAELRRDNQALRVDVYKRQGLTHMHRPVVLGPLVGLVLGYLHTGILTGGTLELVWMGLAPLAGAQPPNVIIGTIVGTAFAITTGVKPDVAVGVAVPFAVAVPMGITFLFSVMSGVMSRCDRMAENADTRGIERVNYLALLALGTFYFLCAFLPIYFGAEHAKTIIDVLPQRLIDGLGVAGGIMPAICFAVLLKIMMKNVYIPYFILGVVAAAWLKLSLIHI